MAKNDKPSEEATRAVVGGATPPTKPPRGYKVARRVTAPLISIVHEKELSFIVDGEMSASNHTDGDDKKQAPMTVVPVTRLDTGEEATLIVQTVMESAFRRTPGGYVGKAFLVQLTGKTPGKRYHNIEVFELEDG